nr:EAL domain-containing protein [Sphaerotilus sulfidivorans]
MRRALERGEFELWYQPLYRLADRHLIGLEALVRLNQPGLPPIGPAEFIPLMEDSGLIVELGAWVTREACRQARAWLDEGLDCGRIAVNLSAAEMRRGQTLARLSQALDDSGLPAARLELEITESGLMEHSDAVEPVLRQMREMGVRLAIDDFGTGYSSLARLRRLPVGKLKIDRSFIADLGGETGPQGAQLVSAMIAMGRGLGLSVLAEGIETEVQASQLIALGCEAGQGYLFGRPAPAAVARQWLSPLPENADEALAQTIWPDI